MSWRCESYERAQGNNGDSARLSATGKIRQTKKARNNLTPFQFFSVKITGQETRATLRAARRSQASLPAGESAVDHQVVAGDEAGGG